MLILYQKELPFNMKLLKTVKNPLKKFFFILFLFFLSFSSFSENLQNETEKILAIKGFNTYAIERVPLKVKWNEKWFGGIPSNQYNHNLAQIAAIFSDASYCDVKNEEQREEFLNCYRELGFQEKNIQFNYDLDYKSSVWGNNQCAFSFAYKQIDSSKGKRNLIFIIIRGTPLSADEWISNINVSDKLKTKNEYHEGFLTAAKQVESSFISFLLKNKLDIEDCFLFITGHSRGAAVANILSERLLELELFNPKNIYTYTFACPNVTTRTDCQDEKFSFIWNIINGEDIVPFMPPSDGQWNYDKFGNTKVFVNMWNSKNDFKNEVLPKVNEIYRQFYIRDFSPFETGTFLPIQISTLIKSLMPTVDSLYSGILDLRKRGQNIFERIFPEENNVQLSQNNGKSSPKSAGEFIGLIAQKATKWGFNQFGLEVQYLLDSFVDMHSAETYLSFLLALDENEAFSDIPSAIYSIKGTGDFAIFDDKDNCLVTIIDNSVKISEIVRPVAANSLFSGDVSIGLPQNQKFKIILSKESLIPSTLKIKKIEYSSSGRIIAESEYKKVSSSYSSMVSIPTINLLEHDKTSFTEFSQTKIKGGELKNIKSKAKINHIKEFNILGEFSLTSNSTTNLGVHFGNKNIYGSFLFGHNNANFGRSLEFSSGIGTQLNLINQILLDSEFYTNLFCALDETYVQDGKENVIIPEFRFTISFKPKKRIKFFMGTNLEFHISDFNDTAFESYYRKTGAEKLENNSKFNIIPNFVFGVRF